MLQPADAMSKSTDTDLEPNPKRRSLETTSPDKGAAKSSVSPATEKAPTSPAPPTTKPSTTSKPPYANQRTSEQPSQLSSSAPSPMGNSLPLLRSSPVSRADTAAASSSTQASSAAFTNTVSATSESKDGKLERALGDGTPPAKSEENSNAEAPQQRRRQRNVTWAPDEKLLDVHIIDNRAELVRVWDPESRITLPFTPTTLQALISEDQNQENQSTESAMNQSASAVANKDSPRRNRPHSSSFEAALKREFDMELERTRRAREEIKNRLNAMSPSCRWSRPIVIVLPTECRIDSDMVEPFTLTETDSLLKMRQNTYSSSHAESPRSPPPEATALGQYRNSDAHVPTIPVSENGNEIQSMANSGMDSGASKGKNLHRENFDQGEKSKASAYGRTHDRHGKLGGNELRSSRAPAHEVGNTNRRGGATEEVPIGHANSQKSSMRQGGLGFRPGGGGKGMEDKGQMPLPPEAVHHLLSALQSSGLLRPGVNGPLADPQNPNSDHRLMDKDMVPNAFPSHLPHGESSTMRNDSKGLASHGENERGEGEHHANHNLQNPVPPVSSADVALGAHPLMGHGQQLPLNFGSGNQQTGMLDCMPFPMPPMPPPPLGMPSLMPIGLPMPMGLPMGLPLNMSHPPLAMNQPPGPGINPPSSSGRNVETISRPKTKPSKQRKRCKYFGTKQGCRDGSSCMFAHN